jgi:hypothetical protein
LAVQLLLLCLLCGFLSWGCVGLSGGALGERALPSAPDSALRLLLTFATLRLKSSAALLFFRANPCLSVAVFSSSPVTSSDLCGHCGLIFSCFVRLSSVRSQLSSGFHAARQCCGGG